MITVAIVVGAFIAIVMAGTAVVLRAGIDREETDFSLRGQPATRTAALTRHVVGLYVRTPQDSAHADEVADLAAGAGTRPFPAARPGR